MNRVYEEEVKAKQKIILQLKKEIADIHANRLIEDTSISWDNAALAGYDNVLFILAFLMGINVDYRFVCDFLYEYDNELGNSWQVEGLLERHSCFALNEYVDGSWYWNTIGRSEDGQSFNIILHKKGTERNPKFIQRCVRIDENGIYFQNETPSDFIQTANITLPLKGIKCEQFFQFIKWIKNNG